MRIFRCCFCLISGAGCERKSYSYHRRKRTGRIFSALASQSGYRNDWASAEDFAHCDLNRYDLIVTSYPYGRKLLELLAERGRAVLVLADYACDDLALTLAGQANCFYTVKPLNFSNFGTLVQNILDEKGDL
ncbi:MAG: hypothetical protein R2864_13800 [Syntrophotaleaceae bacterium]